MVLPGALLLAYVKQTPSSVDRTGSLGAAPGATFIEERSPSQTQRCAKIVSNTADIQDLDVQLAALCVEQGIAEGAACQRMARRYARDVCPDLNALLSKYHDRLHQDVESWCPEGASAMADLTDFVKRMCPA